MAPGCEPVSRLFMGVKIRGWWKRRKSAPVSSASSKTSGSGVSATRTRFAGAAGSPTWSPELSHPSAGPGGASRSTAAAISATRVTPGIVQPPDLEPPQAGRTRLSGNPPAAARRTAFRRRRPGSRRVARPALGPALHLPDQRALAALPRLPHPLGGGTRPAQHPALGTGAAPARRRRVARRGFPGRLPPGRAGGARGGPPLVRARHPALRRAHAAEQPLPPRRGRLGRGRLPDVRPRNVGPARLPAVAARVLGAARAW